VIGRVEGNDVVIEDDSISRRHAEIRKSGPGYVVRDLESANGTFLNGERVSEAPLRPGDTIKFGVVEFSYSGPAMARGGDGGKEKKKKLMIAVGGTTALLIVVGIAAAKLTEPPPKVDTGAHSLKGGDTGPDQGPDVQALLGMCKSFSDTDGNTLDWSRAIDACDKVLKADPINVDARKLKKTSEKELAQKKIFDNAHKLFELAQEQEAMSEYMKIDSDSYYYRQARSEFKKAAPVEMKHAGELCVSEWKALNFEKAWPDCKRMMDVGYYLGGFDDSLATKNYKTAFTEMQKHFKGKDDWTPRKEYERFLGGITQTDNAVDQRLESIKKMYSDPELAKAVDLFAHDPISGMNAIQRYKGKGGRDMAQATQAFTHMEAAYSAHQSGYEKMLARDLKAASVAFNNQIEADGQLMPKGFESDLVKQTKREISDKFALKGKELYTFGRFPESFDQCEGGGAFTMANPSVLECYSDLENKAATLVDNGCEGASKALRITRKESPTHKKAEKNIKDQGCN
jgi:hypothetical protein